MEGVLQCLGGDVVCRKITLWGNYFGTRHLHYFCMKNRNFLMKMNVKISLDWWTERDLNPRLPRCERGDHTADLPAHRF